MTITVQIAESTHPDNQGKISNQETSQNVNLLDEKSEYLSDGNPLFKYY